jgi:hypothetical protein
LFAAVGCVRVEEQLICVEGHIGHPESIRITVLGRDGEVQVRRPGSPQETATVTGSPSETWREQLRQNVPVFIRFLRACGGFQIR